MSRALWLPGVLRDAGLTVHEVAGWQTRGTDVFDPAGVVVHATAGSALSTDAGEISVLLNGSSSAPPPIAQLYIGRQGHIWVVASGRCNHALTGQPGTPLAGLGNSRLIGIEAANDNRAEPWPNAQYDAYVRAVAAICRHQGWSASRAVGHKEHQPDGKTDPTFNMSAFRLAVANILTSPGGNMIGGLSDATFQERMAMVSNLHDVVHGFLNDQDEGPLGAHAPANPVGAAIRETAEGVRTLLSRPAGEIDAAEAAEHLVAALAGNPVLMDVLVDRIADKVADRLAARLKD